MLDPAAALHRGFELLSIVGMGTAGSGSGLLFPRLPVCGLDAADRYPHSSSPVASGSAHRPWRASPPAEDFTVADELVSAPDVSVRAQC